MLIVRIGEETKVVHSRDPIVAHLEETATREALVNMAVLKIIIVNIVLLNLTKAREGGKMVEPPVMESIVQ